METKSQLRLRSLDVGGQPVGTDRLSSVPSKGADFLTRLQQGMAEVQDQEAQSRRVADAKTSERASERSEQADRDQSRGVADRLARRAQGDERLTERQQEGRQLDQRAAEDRAEDSRAAERRAESRPKRERRTLEDAPAPEPQKDEAPSEAPSAPHTPPSQTATNAPKPVQSPVSSPFSGSAAPATGGSPTPLVQPAATAAAQGVAPTAKAGAQPTASQPASAQNARTSETPAPTKVTRAHKPAPTQQDLERADAVLRQVKVSLKPGMRSANLQLNPAELGRVTIRLRVQDDGVQAVVRAESEATLAVLDRHLPELRAILAQQGFEGAEFDLGMANQSDQGAAQGDSKHDRGQSAGGPIEEEMNLDALALARPLAAAEGGVDLIV